MAWTRLDDQFFANPKVVDLSKDAKLLYLAAVTYSAGQLTDGRITPGAFRIVTAMVDADRSCADELVAAGLWDQEGDVFLIHDYLEYNPSAADVRAKREADRARKRGGVAEDSARNPDGGAAESSPPVPTPVPTPVPEPTPEPKGKHDVRARARGVEAPPAPVAPQEQPYAYYEVLCDELAAVPESPPPSQQLGVAKRLAKKGHSTEDVRGCLRFLLSQDWRTGLVDLRTVESEIDAWKLNGRPAVAKARASPAKRNGGGGMSPSDLFQHADRLRSIEVNGRVQRD